MISPVLALVFLTFLVTARLAFVRFRAAFRNEVPRGYFKLLQGFDPPPHMLAPARNYANLFEMPVLFYAAAILAYSQHIDDRVLITLAWLYVALRWVHTGLTLYWNKVIFRFAAFATSAVVLGAMWIVIATRL